MSQSEKFFLKWNDFQANVSKSFTKLRKESSLFDVTLVSNDLRQVSAHRLVLSACSEFFQTLFENNKTNSNPLIVLDGVNFQEINLILDYIYQGEVSLFQDHLDRFLEIAEKFKVDGLLPSYFKDDLQIPKNVKENINNEHFEHEISNPESHEHEISDTVKERSLKVNQEAIETNNLEMDSKFLELVVQDENKVYTCTLCNKKMTHKTNMKKHIETHMTGLSYPCNQCDKTFSSSNALNIHKTRYHNQ